MAEDRKFFCAYKTDNGDIVVCSNGRLFNLIKDKIPRLEEITTTFTVKNIAQNGNDLLLGLDSYGFNILRDGKIIIPDIIKSKRFERSSFQAFFTDKKNSIWAATDIGLLQLSNNYEFLHLYDIKNGLPDNFVYGILVDAEGDLWLSTNKGLSLFHPTTGKFRNFTLDDGIQSFEFNTGAFYKSKDGEMFFGGVNGFNYFNPQTISYNKNVPQLALTDFKVFDDEIKLDTAIGFKKKLILSHDKNTISFEFAGMEFSNPERNQYASKLEGLEYEWYYSGNRRFVKYDRLKPGTYHLWLKASNNDGEWSKPVQMITIIILSPYWATWWFITLVIVVLVALTILGIRYFIGRKLKKRLQALERRNEIEKIRNRISRDIHDDIGAGLTKISMMSQMARLDVTENKNIDDKLNTLSSSARDLSERLQEIVWAMNPRHDDLNSLLAFLRAYASDFFENSNVKLSFHFPDNIPALPLNPDMRRNLFLCFKEALNNIAKYANASEIFIEADIKTNTFHLMIKDNGKGFDANKNKLTGNGLANMQKRMEEINGQFSIKSKPGTGTEINISFPM